ncbi:hypothetical protein [Oleidesulfovibrio sp.]|uniref:hypothetical protein n=1 Tax=Oleidesulfovibrio sp. TaxID=2909707 RepID=UPI003A873186
MVCLICGSPASVCVAGLPHQESRCLCEEHATPEAIGLLQQAAIQNAAMLKGLHISPAGAGAPFDPPAESPNTEASVEMQLTGTLATKR